MTGAMEASLRPGHVLKVTEVGPVAASRTISPWVAPP